MHSILETSAELSRSGFTSNICLGNREALFNNGHVVVLNDMIFGLSVWSGERFVPLSTLDSTDLQTVKEAIAADSRHFMWFDKLALIKPVES